MNEQVPLAGQSDEVVGVITTVSPEEEQVLLAPVSQPGVDGGQTTVEGLLKFTSPVAVETPGTWLAPLRLLGAGRLTRERPPCPHVEGEGGVIAAPTHSSVSGNG